MRNPGERGSCGALGCFGIPLSRKASIRGCFGSGIGRNSEGDVSMRWLWQELSSSRNESCPNKAALEEIACLILHGGFSCWKNVERAIPDTLERNIRGFYLLYDFLHVMVYFCRLVAREVAGPKNGAILADQIDAYVLQNLLLEFDDDIEYGHKAMEKDFLQGLTRSRQSYARIATTTGSFDDLFRLFGKHASIDAGLSDEPSFAYRTQMLTMSAIPALDLHRRLAELVQ